jgi:hypothetical protein
LPFTHCARGGAFSFVSTVEAGTVSTADEIEAAEYVRKSLVESQQRDFIYRRNNDSR